MKKIIELAEQVYELRLKYNSDTLSRDLHDAIAERKRLEQTPITEEWLLEHGWTEMLEHLGCVKIMVGNDHLEYDDYLEYDIIRKELSVFRNYEEGKCIYPDALIDNVDNVAKLYDACELCGIELK